MAAPMDGIISYLFPPNPREIIRNHRRLLQRAMKSIDMERIRLQTHEQQLVKEIRKAGAHSRLDLVRTMAHNLVHCRSSIQELLKMHGRLDDMIMQTSRLGHAATMADGMQQMTKALKALNRKLGLPRLQKIVQEFEKENDVLDTKNEIIEETVDDAVDMDIDDTEEAEDAIVEQVLDELGLHTAQGVVEGFGDSQASLLYSMRQ